MATKIAPGGEIRGFSAAPPSAPGRDHPIPPGPHGVAATARFNAPHLQESQTNRL